MFFDNQPATEQQLNLFRSVRVDQAIGMVTEAEMEMEMLLNDNGEWVDFAEPFTEPFVRVRIEIKAGDGSFTPLIDGPVVGQKLVMSAAPNDSNLSLRVHDDSFKLNQYETVAVYEQLTAADIARQLFIDAGMIPQVDILPPAFGLLERAVVQRGTAMQLLRDLARQHGMFVYVKPGPLPGISIGVFQHPALHEGDLPELLLIGDQSNLEKLNIEFDGLRPFAAVASQVDVSNQQVLRAEASASSQTPLGDEPAHDVVEPARVFLARTRETDGDLNAAVTAAADSASWAWTATGEVDAAAYPAVMQPYGTVSVAGAGPMSGLYLISQVVHHIDDQNYRQQFTLRRNARSTVGGGGGFLAGVF